MGAGREGSGSMKAAHVRAWRHEWVGLMDGAVGRAISETNILFA